VLAAERPSRHGSRQPSPRFTPKRGRHRISATSQDESRLRAALRAGFQSPGTSPGRAMLIRCAWQARPDGQSRKLHSTGIDPRQRSRARDSARPRAPEAPSDTLLARPTSDRRNWTHEVQQKAMARSAGTDCPVMMGTMPAAAQQLKPNIVSSWGTTLAGCSRASTTAA
jgi:hypothetical protein